MEDFFEHLEDKNPDGSLNWGKSRKHKEETRYVCTVCGGSGKYQGARIHQVKDHCFACRGKDYFSRSPEARMKSKARRENRKARERDLIRDDVVEFSQNQPEMFAQLEAARNGGTNSEFIASLAEQLWKKGHLSPAQIAAWHRGNDKLKAKIAERKAETEKFSVEVDLAPIRHMFETAAASGYKKPKYRAEGLVLSLAPSTGRNPGAIYVKDENDAYLGKIIETSFMPSREGKDSGSILLEIAKDPLQAALRYGQRTGKCACCGRELTNHSSIDLGIGPVCKQK
jgi:hypothetical protein